MPYRAPRAPRAEVAEDFAINFGMISDETECENWLTERGRSVLFATLVLTLLFAVGADARTTGIPCSSNCGPVGFLGGSGLERRRREFLTLFGWFWLETVIFHTCSSPDQK